MKKETFYSELNHIRDSYVLEAGKKEPKRLTFGKAQSFFVDHPCHLRAAVIHQNDIGFHRLVQHRNGKRIRQAKKTQQTPHRIPKGHPSWPRNTP